MNPLSGAGQSEEITRKDEIWTESGSQWVENISSVLRAKRKQRERWQQPDQHRLWTEKSTTNSSIGLKNRKICLKQRWKRLKSWLHKVFPTGDSQCKTESVLRNKNQQEKTGNRRIKLIWIRECKLITGKPLQRVARRKFTRKSEKETELQTDSNLAELYPSLGIRKEQRKNWQQQTLCNFWYKETSYEKAARQAKDAKRKPVVIQQSQSKTRPAFLQNSICL